MVSPGPLSPLLCVLVPPQPSPGLSFPGCSDCLSYFLFFLSLVPLFSLPVFCSLSLSIFSSPVPVLQPVAVFPFPISLAQSVSVSPPALVSRAVPGLAGVGVGVPSAPGYAVTARLGSGRDVRRSMCVSDTRGSRAGSLFVRCFSWSEEAPAERRQSLGLDKPHAGGAEEAGGCRTVLVSL